MCLLGVVFKLLPRNLLCGCVIAAVIRCTEVHCCIYFQIVEFIVANPRLLSVQCYAWTEYKFTCVCVSVCLLSITLSVNSPTGQTSQQIFTVDTVA